eukprot:3306892-Rhodomonas_salina.1
MWSEVVTGPSRAAAERESGRAGRFWTRRGSGMCRCAGRTGITAECDRAVWCQTTHPFDAAVRGGYRGAGRCCCSGRRWQSSPKTTFLPPSTACGPSSDAQVLLGRVEKLGACMAVMVETEKVEGGGWGLVVSCVFRVKIVE